MNTTNICHILLNLDTFALLFINIFPSEETTCSKLGVIDNGGIESTRLISILMMPLFMSECNNKCQNNPRYSAWIFPVAGTMYGRCTSIYFMSSGFKSAKTITVSPPLFQILLDTSSWSLDL